MGTVFSVFHGSWTVNFGQTLLLYKVLTGMMPSGVRGLASLAEDAVYWSGDVGSIDNLLPVSKLKPDVSIDRKLEFEEGHGSL